MPEGDTVWLAASRLHEALAGDVLLTSDFRVPQLATADLSGATVLEVVPRGKHLLTRLRTREGAALSLHTHFRMDGSWHLYRPGDRWTGGPDWQVRAVLSTASWQAVGYRLPVVELMETAQEHTAVGHLGPDALGPDWDADLAVANLLAEPDAEIGTALLEQRKLAGLGNLYRCEALFLRGLSPWLKVGEVPDLRGLVERGRTLMELNKARWEQATTGSLRPGQEHWVFERSGKPCRRCGTRIRSAEQGRAPQARLTYWCPRDQLGPSPAPQPGARRPRTLGRGSYRP